MNQSMLYKRISAVFLSFCICALATVIAGDIPGAVRIATDDAHFAAGVQLSPGTNGDFELFSGQLEQQAIHPLGRYNGRLVGVAVNHDGDVLALTRDGSLSTYGDNPESIALPDSRWNMQGLAIWNSAPAAIAYDNGELFLVHPDKEQNWIQEERSVAQTEHPFRVELVALPDSLHLFWTTSSDSLSGGDIRHAVMDGSGTWVEQQPLILGSVAGFCAYADGETVHLAALAADPLGASPRHVIAKVLQNGEWQTEELPSQIRETLKSSPFSFDASVSGERTLLLSSGIDGTELLRVTPGNEMAVRSALTPAPQGVELGLAPRFTGLITIGLMIGLLLLYCRRSRTLSRLHPERAPDLLSRGAALGIDWLIASFAMGVYHWASGDMRILPDLLRLGKIESIFWSNLAGLAFFMFISETLFGATPGKYLAGLRVTSVFGGRPGVLQIVLRNFLRIVDMYPISGAFPGLIGAAVALFNRGRQRIGDIMAGTVVRRHLPLDKRGFLLASASPRRLDLLGELGVRIRVEAPDIDEEAIRGKTPDETVRMLAEAKARSMREKARPPEVVVAADTIVVLEGEVLGKPADEADAMSMLRRLSGKSHSVFTGVAVWDPASGRALTDVEETEVEFRILSEREIASYVATGDPLDKAGAYGIQTGYLVKQVRGSLSNVAGLPMEKLQGMLDFLTL